MAQNVSERRYKEKACRFLQREGLHSWASGVEPRFTFHCMTLGFLKTMAHTFLIKKLLVLFLSKKTSIFSYPPILQTFPSLPLILSRVSCLPPTGK